MAFTTAQFCRWEDIDHTGECFTPRTGHVTVNQEGSFYVFGGTDNRSHKNDVYAYNVDTEYWMKIQCHGRPPAPRSGATAVLACGVIWIFGGYNKSENIYYNDVYTFNVGSMRWHEVQTKGESPPSCTDHTAVLTDDTVMLVFGGCDSAGCEMGGLRELRLDDHQWIPVEASAGIGLQPQKRFGHSSVVFGNSMYVFGGWDGRDTLQDFFQLDLGTTSWTKLPKQKHTPRSRYRHTATLCGEAMFVFGGIDRYRDRFADLYEFDFTCRLWSKVNTMAATHPSARTFHSAIAHAGHIYILGGWDGTGLNDCHKICLRTERELARCMVKGSRRRVDQETKTVDETVPFTWKRMPPKPPMWLYTPRTGHCVVADKSCFYLFGGSDAQTRQNDFNRYSVDRQVWGPLKPVRGTAPSPRSGMKAVAHEGKIYFLGGYTKKGGDYYNDLFIFQIGRRLWTKIEKPNCPGPRTDHTVAICRGNLYVYGGFDGKSQLDDLHEFGISSHKWGEVDMGETENQPLGRSGHSAAVYDTGMYIFGGWNGTETMDDLYEFSTVTRQWFPVPGRGDVASPRYRHTSIVYGCTMFVHGGVDKQQEKRSDMYEFNFDSRIWSKVDYAGGVAPSARTFHCAVEHSGFMYIFGGFDGERQNDLFRISLPLRETRKNGEISDKIAGLLGLDTEVDQNMPEGERLKRQLEALQERLDGEVDRHLCKVCFEREINTVLLDCKHRAVCDRCLAQLQNCPCCRTAITKTVRSVDT